MHFLIFLLLCVYASPALAQTSHQWKICTQESDCLVVGGGCCIDAVHKAFKAQGEDYCARQNTLVECPRALNPSDFKANCQKTTIACLDGSTESCLSKTLKCTLKDTHGEGQHEDYTLE